ncbi:indolepyruvate ferredoxin oxidoreductase family protein [Streptomyces sp. BE147]|uniref:indolepyruvate ferredoxin oxidoreductase family protein n=1 Tax=Streptomyces sp. BE147 TaxID=3002524 RepID=UPI002E76EDFA|nr:indolepyruvate ferredoxin oxidoreductase family protein [Streptomyces sp. BE147]MEE1740259.1 indolepyruvate ferredoxin oxidoreductase family protein [Streptomyces sp. BE147]
MDHKDKKYKKYKKYRTDHAHHNDRTGHAGLGDRTDRDDRTDRSDRDDRTDRSGRDDRTETPKAARPTLQDRYVREEGSLHLTGIQALARLTLDLRRADRRAGRRTAAFVSGYEGSPLAGYDMELERCRELLDEYDVVLRPGVNEELAATAVQGTQLAAMQPDKRVDGITGIWYGKSPGLDRASDALRHNNLMGTHPDGGALALVGDDPAAKSSTVPGASELLLADLGIPTLYPSDPQEALDFGLHGVAMSRVSGLWVALKIVTAVADGSGTVDVGAGRVSPVVPDLFVDGTPVRHAVAARMVQPALGELERSRDGARLEIARRYAAVNGLNRITRTGPDDRVGIIAPGKTYLDLRQALTGMGLDDAGLARHGVRLLHLGMIHPLEPTVVERFAAGLRHIVVVEEKRPLIETAVKDLLYGSEAMPTVSGKRAADGSALFPLDGELDPDTIAARLAPTLAALGVRTGGARSTDPQLGGAGAAKGGRALLSLLPLVTRTPYFCSGCPHNLSTKAPKGSTVGAGIGCHAMVTLMDPAQAGEVIGMTQMGGEGAQWIGMEPFLERNHLIQNLGDGTFHHSGSLAVRAAVAAGVNVTYKLLYNSAVAMTGGQQPAGVMTVPAIAGGLLAEGVARIIITTEDVKRYRKVKLPKGVRVWHRDRLTEAQETLAAVPGVTVLIHDQECATELRRKRKRGLAPDPVERIMINERVCEGCGDCGRKSNCLSVQPVETEFGRKTRIDQSSCNKDFSCLAGDCPSFLTVVPARGKSGVAPGKAGAASDKSGAAPGKSGAAPAARTVPMPDAARLPEPAHRPTASHTTRITGVGGSGVVTLAQILSTAAALAGRHVRALDQTGLAQKGGAVVSDIKITDEPTPQAGKAAEAECDLYLGCDLLVAADAGNLAAAAPSRTVAVVSTAEVPTGQMVIDPQASFPAAGPIRDRIREATRTAVFLDARHLANTLLGADQYANLLLTGAAHQSGALPLPAEAVEEAITLNGVKVEENLKAFRYGRLAIADPAGFAEALAAAEGPKAPRPSVSAVAAGLIAQVGAAPGSELARLLDVRVPDLIAYQNAAYATRYTRFVERVRRAEEERVPGSAELAGTVARHLYKLMAYKDEYEVARLSLDPAVEQEVKDRFGEGARMSYRLHPPALRALGMERKIVLGPWFKPAFRLLAAMRHVRGTRLDLFGAASVRRTERALITEYEAMITEICRTLSPADLPSAVEVAALPDVVRGYEGIKMAAVGEYRAKADELMGRFAGRDSAPAHAGTR